MFLTASYSPLVNTSVNPHIYEPSLNVTIPEGADADNIKKVRDFLSKHRVACVSGHDQGDHRFYQFYYQASKKGEPNLLENSMSGYVYAESVSDNQETLFNNLLTLAKQHVPLKKNVAKFTVATVSTGSSQAHRATFHTSVAGTASPDYDPQPFNPAVAAEENLNVQFEEAFRARYNAGINKAGITGGHWRKKAWGCGLFRVNKFSMQAVATYAHNNPTSASYTAYILAMNQHEGKDLGKAMQGALDKAKSTPLAAPGHRKR